MWNTLGNCPSTWYCVCVGGINDMVLCVCGGGWWCVEYIRELSIDMVLCVCVCVGGVWVCVCGGGGGVWNTLGNCPLTWYCVCVGGINDMVLCVWGVLMTGAVSLSTHSHNELHSP